MQLVFARLGYEVLGWYGFFDKLQQFIGEFRIEGQTFEDISARRVTISFYTDKVHIDAGRSRQVELTARRTEVIINEAGNMIQDWEFIQIAPAY